MSASEEASPSVVEESAESAEGSPSDADRKAPRVDLKHGFLRNIHRNQQVREFCDRDQEALRMAIRFRRSLKSNPTSSASTTKRPERQLYTPRKRRTDAAAASGADDAASASPARGASASPATSSAAEQSPLLFVMDVEVSPGQWQALEVRERDTAQSLARQAALANAMEDCIAAALAYHLAVNIDKVKHADDE